MPEQPGDQSPAEQAPPAAPLTQPPTDAIEAAPTTEPATEPIEVAPAEPATRPVAPRWTGSAPVPPSSVRHARGKPPNRTLELPADERAALEADPPPEPGPVTAADPPPPVDPWADAALTPAATPWLPALPAAPPAPPRAPAAAPRAPAPARSASPPAATKRLPVPEQARPSRTAPPPRQTRPVSRRPSAPPVPRPPHQPPPGWIPPGYELRRRRRRWPWRLSMLILTVGCCCACPAYFLKPYLEQYPATVSLPAEVAGLALRDDEASTRTVRTLEDEVRGEHLLAEEVFAGVYSDGRGQRVTLFGATGFRVSPEDDLAAELTRLTPEYRLTGLRDVDAGAPGGYARCGAGESDGDDLILCAWADHGSLGVATFSRGSLDEGAKLLQQLHATTIARG